uniref:FAM21/CAPZIP domain-containing protein n=1 Tax=Phlebotomus papatasi TaxID=29031 RepID=A0A1B0CYN3_PHLPP
MKDISRNLEVRCRETKLRINQMCLSGEEVNVQLGNVTNRLLALQHTQFVENRVQEDEDVPGTTEKKTERDPEPRQLSPMSSIKSILAESVACLNKCYEKIEVQLDEDSDDDDEPGKSVVFRPRDPFAHRPLPFLIGSKEFKEKWHVGLVDSESDTENEAEDQYSESGSESGHSVSLRSAGGNISGSEADSVWGLQATSNALAHKSASQISLEDDRFSKVSDQPEIFNPVPAQRAYFQPPKLTPRTNPPANPVTNLFSSSPPKVPSTSKAPGLFDDLVGDDFDTPAAKTDSKPPRFFRDQPDSRKTVNLFDDEPPEFEAPPKSSNQKSNQTGLFLDSDNDEDKDVFVPPTRPQKKEVPVIAKKVDISTNLFNEEPPVDDFHEVLKKAPVNLFDDNDDEFNSFMSSLSTSTKKNSQIEKKASENLTKPKLSNLFDDDDEPDDFFDTLLKGSKSKVKPQPAKREIQSQKKDVKAQDMKNEVPKEEVKKDESKAEVKKDVSKEEVEKDVPKADVKHEIPMQITKTDEKLPTKSKNMSLFNDSDDDDDIFAGAKKKTETTKKDQDQKESLEDKLSKHETVRSSADEKPSPSQDNFPEIKAMPEESPESIQEVQRNKEQKEILIQDPPQKSDEVKNVADSFEAKPPEDWLEASQNFHAGPPPLPSDPSPTNIFNEPPVDEEFPTAKRESKAPGLFDDLEDDEDDFFVPKSQLERPHKSTNLFLFDDLPPDDDLFVDRKVVSEVFYDDFAESFPPEVTSVNATGNSYLFNDQPPADDWHEEKVKSEKKSLFSTSSSQDEPDEVFASARSLIKSHENPENPPEEPINKPKIVPNKLNKTMAINVAALLPGAKRPSFKNAQESSRDNPPNETLDIPPESPKEKVEEVSKELDEKIVEVTDDSGGLLTNLNKNRAKIPQKRKPSTRRGRQETYRKSLIVENDEKQENTHNSLFEDDPSEKDNIGKLASVEEPVRNKKLPQVITDDLFSETDPEIAIETEKNEIVRETKAMKTSEKPRNSLQKNSQSVSKSLFDSDDEDDSDIFSTKKPKNVSKSTSEPTKIAPKSTSLFGDSDDDDDDLFGTSSKTNNVKITAPITKVDKKIVKKSAAGADPLADLF